MNELIENLPDGWKLDIRKDGRYIELRMFDDYQELQAHYKLIEFKYDDVANLLSIMFKADVQS